MGSYIISVSLYAGCYRHIRIRETATLWQFHEVIQNAFEFDDDHLHAFFLDNRTWSHKRAYFSEKSNIGEQLTKNCTLKKAGFKPGDKFKYVFDFGDEWVFQCRVLRYIEEATDIPCIVRSVGEPPEQYPDAEFDDIEEDEEDFAAQAEWERTLPEALSEKELQNRYASLSVPKETVDKLCRYCTAVARIYGIAPVTLAYELYCKYEEPLTMEDYLACTEVLRHDGGICFSVLGKESLYRIEEPSVPEEREIIYGFLLLSGPELYYYITEQRGAKPQYQPTHEELIGYADERTIPNTLQAQAMLHFLRKALRKKDMAEALTHLLICIVAAEYPMDNVLGVFEEAGIVFDIRTMKEFLHLYQELNNHTRKFVNNGFTPQELSYNSKQKPDKNHKGQMSLF